MYICHIKCQAILCSVELCTKYDMTSGKTMVKADHWSGLPCPSPGDLPNQFSCLAGGFFTV